MATEVLYIAGVPRSGSTLLGKVLGQSSEAVYVGELWDLYGQLRKNGSCGCGQDLSSCAYWSMFKAEELSVFDEIAHSNRVRDLIFGDGNEIENTAPVSDLYRKVKSVFSASIIVDTSKFPSYLKVLEQTDDIDLKVIHLVRDPRAVVYSWLKRPLHDKERDPGFLDSLSNFRFRNPIRWGLVWAEWNYLLRRIWGGRENYYMMRYEDFCQSPQNVLQRALDKLGVDERPNWESEHEIKLTSQHTVKGNPDRFETGRIHVRERTEWTERMSLPVFVITTIVSFLQLHRYGYNCGLKYFKS